MKKLLVLSVVVALLIASAVFLTAEAPFTLLFGWIPFLIRVFPKMSFDWPSIAVGGASTVLFILGVHWMGRTRQNLSHSEGPPPRTWKFRWSLASVAAVVLLFAAGISVVGAVHQVVWILTSDRPLVGEALKNRTHSKSNLWLIGNGVFNYASSNSGALPAGGTFNPEGEMRHSWETQILPYMGFMGNIDMDRAWNDPVNQRYFKCVLPPLINSELHTPSLTDSEGYGLSHYAANSRVMAGNRAVKPADLTNGGSNTILIGEVNTGFQPWGHPVNWRDPVRGINRSPAGFGGPPQAGGANFVMGDGSVRFVSDQISPEVLQALSSP